MGDFEWKELNRFDQRRLYAFRRIYWIEDKWALERPSRWPLGGTFDLIKGIFTYQYSFLPMNAHMILIYLYLIRQLEKESWMNEIRR